MSRLTHRTRQGSTYFVTTKAWESRNLFQTEEVAGIIIAKLFHYRHQGAYLLHEFGIMPNHLHLLLTPGAMLERALQLIKGGSSREIHIQRGGNMPLWQSGFHDWTVRDAGDFRAKQEYIRLNPVRAGLVERAEDWPFGSACAKFESDCMPERLKTSGAKAPEAGVPAVVGAKAPTP